MLKLDVKIQSSNEHDLLRCLEQVKQALMRGYRQGGGPNTFGSFTFRLLDSTPQPATASSPSAIRH